MNHHSVSFGRSFLRGSGGSAGDSAFPQVNAEVRRPRACRRMWRQAGILFAILTLESGYALSASGALKEKETVVLDNPTDLVLLLDVSGSMIKTDPDYSLREAAARCIDILPESSRAAVIPFSDELGSELPFTGLEDGGAAVHSYLSGLSYTSGDTDIGLGLTRAAEIAELSQSGSGTGRSRILLVTDGVIDLPGAADENAAEKDSLTSALVSAERMRERGIRIDTAGIGNQERIDGNLLGYLAERTGGWFAPVSPEDSLPDALEDLMRREGRTEMLPDGGSGGEGPEETEQFPAEETEDSTEDASLAETEAVTEKSTEADEAETGMSDAPAVIGKIPDTVTVRALLPDMCRTCVDLHTLFDYTETAATEEFPFFAAETSDRKVAVCTLKEDELHITGVSNGVTSVFVTAERGGKRSEIAFSVRIDAVFGSAGRAAAAAAVCMAAVLLLLMAVRTAAGGTPLRGKICFYVKMEDQRIFGVPTKNTLNLSGLRKKTRLSDLVRDPYLEGSDLKKVILKGTHGGVRVVTHTQACVLCDDSGNAVSALLLTDGMEFRILCAASAGTAVIAAVYHLYGQAGTGEEQDDSRTRLLV